MHHMHKHWGAAVGRNSLHVCVSALVFGSFPPLLQDFDGLAPGFCCFSLSAEHKK